MRSSSSAHALAVLARAQFAWRRYRAGPSPADFARTGFEARGSAVLDRSPERPRALTMAGTALSGATAFFRGGIAPELAPCVLLPRFSPRPEDSARTLRLASLLSDSSALPPSELSSALGRLADSFGNPALFGRGVRVLVDSRPSAATAGRAFLSGSAPAAAFGLATAGRAFLSGSAPAAAFGLGTSPFVCSDAAVVHAASGVPNSRAATLHRNAAANSRSFT